MSDRDKAFWLPENIEQRVIEDVSQRNGVGSLAQPVTRAFYGINHRQQPGGLPINKDIYGLTFFTRPLMNLSTDNIRNDRRLARFLQTDPMSVGSYIRSVLDPQLESQNVVCPLVNPRQAFIPILTNTLENIAGWRDVSVPTYTTPDGVAKESMSFVDGMSIDYSTYDITASFRNVVGDPITNLFELWCHYMALVFEGIVVPYPRYWIDYEIDYNTRIYRLNLDPTKRYVTRITACGAAFPLNSPVGAIANFEHSTPVNTANDKISISFRAMGMISNDPVLIQEFNDTVVMFNPNMHATQRYGFYRQIPPYALNLFNNAGYPYIDETTNELQWWIEREEFRKVIPDAEAQALDAQYGLA